MRSSRPPLAMQSGANLDYVKLCFKKKIHSAETKAVYIFGWKSFNIPQGASVIADVLTWEHVLPFLSVSLASSLV